jgi:hypothetical protein
MAALTLGDMEQSLFRDTSGTMRFVGIFWVVIAALLFVPPVLAAGVSLALPGATVPLKLLLSLVDSTLMAGLGIYTLKSAGSLARFAQQTEGDAAPALMKVFSDLRGMFLFWAVQVGVDLATDAVELVVK